jgi:hypothetical protein
VVLREEGEDKGCRAGRKIVDVIERERSDDEYEKEWWKQNGIRQCRQEE